MHPHLPPADRERLAQAVRLMEQGKLEQARASIARLLQKHPKEPVVCVAMADSFILAQTPAQAVFYLDRAVELDPSEIRIRIRRARALTLLDRHADAAADLRSIAERSPEDLDARSELVRALVLCDHIADAETAARDAIARFGPAPRLVYELSSLLLRAGEPDRAGEELRAALADQPEDLNLSVLLAYTLNFLPGLSAEEVFAAHRRYGTLLERSLALVPPLRWNVSFDPERQLRVGFVSEDFFRHSVAYFFEPLLRALPRGECDTYVYHVGTRTDDTTRRLASLTPHWLFQAKMPHDALAARVLADRIDVLIDLSGFTAGHRLPAFARRPAPLQISCIGYPSTTGLSAVDLRFVDSCTDPRDAASLTVERLVRLDPCFLCYAPGADTPPARARESGPPTFVSFNALPKHHHALFGLWARILARVPDARLVMKNPGLNDPAVRERTFERLAHAGIPRERVELRPAAKGERAHLLQYHDGDVALDTFPYHGTTTTCESLVMGVPVVTLLGDRHASRVGASLLEAVGLDDLVAGSADEYVDIAARLALDRPRLERLRATLRDRFDASPLRDETGYARRFADAIREAWRETCRRR